MAMNGFLQDLRYALRQLRKAPGFALTAVLTLALGIGANTAIFSLLDQALLRSLPVRDPQQLVVLQGTGTAWEGSSHSHGGNIESYFYYPMYKDLRDHHEAFDGLLTTPPADIEIGRIGVSQSGRAELVSGNYFDVLGVKPAFGRVLTQADDLQPDANPVAVLSFDFWRDHLGADSTIVESDIAINGRPFHVLGVAAPGFRSAIWGETPSLFVPVSMLNEVIPDQGKRLVRHTDRSLNIIGRLKPGESRAQAEASLAPLWHALRADELKTFGTRSQRFTDDFLTRSRLLLLPGAGGFSYQRDDFQGPLLAVMAMAFLVLLIASVNVASLLLVRSAGRAREFSVRYALGAGFPRILRQLLLEGLLVGICGGAAGMLLAPIAIRALVHQMAGDQGAAPFNTGIDARLLFVNFSIALLVSIFFSLAPALQLRRLDINVSMGQKSSTGTSAMLGFRRAVVCLQIGISVLLLVGAGLFVRTMQNLRSVDAGFVTSHLTTFGINPKLAGYAPAAVPALHQRVLDTLAALPGVQAVAATDDPELAGNDHGGNVTVAGYTPPPDDDYDVEIPHVNPTYFSALQIPLVTGRSFADGDTIDHPKVAIVNETFSKHFCGTAAGCLGRMMGDGGGNKVNLDTEIVGIVRDSKHTGLREKVIPTFFRPLKQDPAPAGLTFYLRTYTDPAQALTTVSSTMQRLDSSLVLVDLRTMEGQIDDELSSERMVSLLAVSFGILTTLLAGIGLYGVLAYSTAQRTQEIGIRIALGSTRLAISRIVLGDVSRLAGIGIAIALPVSFVLSRLLRSQLFGVSPADPLTIIGAVLLISVVTLFAALVPARRAAAVNPIEALRTE
jgi:putative ABC transport system permease protein